MRKRIVVIIGLLCVISVTVVLLFFRGKSFDYSYNCIYYTLGEQQSKDIKVTLSGQFKTEFTEELRNAIKAFDFGEIIHCVSEGAFVELIEYTISIDGEKYPNPEPEEVIVPYNRSRIFGNSGNVIIDNRDDIVCKLEYRDKSYYVNMSYFTFNITNPDKSEYKSIGGLYVDKDFDNIIIFLSNTDATGSYWSTEDGNDVIVSTDTIEEAENQAKTLYNLSLGSN